MKLLFDENLPASLVSHLTDLFPLSASVTIIGLGNRPDQEIIQHAKANGFIVVTKDVHFYRNCVAFGHPPKVIWIRTGNCGLHRLIQAFQRAKERIALFELDNDPYLILK